MVASAAAEAVVLDGEARARSPLTPSSAVRRQDDVAIDWRCVGAGTVDVFSNCGLNNDVPVHAAAAAAGCGC